MLQWCHSGVTLLLRCCCTVVTLMRGVHRVFVSTKRWSLSASSVRASLPFTLMLHWCNTVVTLLLHCCCASITLLLHSSYTVVCGASRLRVNQEMEPVSVISMRTHAHTYARMHVHMYTHTHTHTNEDTRTHAHTRAYTCAHKRTNTLKSSACTRACVHTELTYIHALTQQRKGMSFAHW
jgi:hypothetical protein